MPGGRGLGAIIQSTGKAAGNALKQGVKNILGVGGPPSTRRVSPSKIDLKKSPQTTDLRTLQDNSNSLTPANKGGSSRGVGIPLDKPEIRDRPKLQDKPQNVKNPEFPPKKAPIIPIVPPLIPNIPPKPTSEPVDNRKIPFPPTPPKPSPTPSPRPQPKPGERTPPTQQTERCTSTKIIPGTPPGTIVFVGERRTWYTFSTSYEFRNGAYGWFQYPRVVHYTLPNRNASNGIGWPYVVYVEDMANGFIGYAGWGWYGSVSPGTPDQTVETEIPCPPPGVDPPQPPPKLEDCPDMSGCECETVYQIVQSLVAKYTAETQNHVTASTEIGMDFVNESHDYTRNTITTSKDEIINSLKVCCDDLSTKIDNIKLPEIKQFDEESFRKWMVALLADFGKRTLSYIETLFKQQTYFLEDRMINYHQQTTSSLSEIRSEVNILIEFQQEITNYFESVLDDLATIRQLIIECCKKITDVDFTEVLELIESTSIKLNQDLRDTIINTSGIIIGSLANQIVVAGNNVIVELGGMITDIESLLAQNFESRTRINRQNLKLVYDLLLEIYKCCLESGDGTGGINLAKDCCEDIKGTLSFSLCDSEEKVDPANEIAEDVAGNVVGGLTNLVASLVPGKIDDVALGALQGTIKKIVKGFVAVKIKPYVNTSKNSRAIPYSGYAFKGIESQIKALSQQLDLAVKEICSKSVECPDEDQYIFSGSLEFATCDKDAPEINIWDTLTITTSNFIVSRVVSEIVSKLFPFLKAEFNDKTLDAIIGNLEDTIKNELKSLFYRFLPLPKNERLKPYHGYNFEGIEKMILALSDQINYVTEQLCGKLAATVPVSPSAPIITKVILPESAIDGLTNFQCEDYDGPQAFPYQGSGIQGLSSQLVAIENGMNIILKQVCSVKKDIKDTDNIDGSYSFKCGNELKSFTYNGKGLLGLSSQLAALAQGVNAVLSKVCDSDDEVKKEIDNSRRQIIENQNTNTQTTNNNIDNTRNEYEQELEQIFQTIGDTISNISNTVNNINNTVNNPDGSPDSPSNNQDENISGQIQLICNGIPLTYNYSGLGLEGISNGIEAMGNALQMVLDQVCKPDDFIVGELSIECDGYPYSFSYSGVGFDAITSSVEALNKVMQIVLNQVCQKNQTDIEFVDETIELTCNSETTSYNYYGIGLGGISQGINALSKAIQLVLDRICLPDPIADSLTVVCDTETHSFSYQGDGTSAIASGLQSITGVLQIILNEVCALPSKEEYQQSTSEEITTITENLTEIISEEITTITENLTEIINQEISTVEETIGDILEISNAITNTLNTTNTAQIVAQNQLQNLAIILNDYTESYEKNTAEYNTALTQIGSTISLISESVNVEISNTHRVSCDVKIDKQIKPKPLYVTNGIGLYVVDTEEAKVKEIVKNYLNPSQISFAGFLPNTLLAGIPAGNIVASGLIAGFPSYSAIYSALGLAANQLLNLIMPAAVAAQFDGLSFNKDEDIYIARATPNRTTQYFKVKPDTGEVLTVSNSPNNITEGVGALTKTFVGQTDLEDPRAEYTYALGVSNSREDFKLLRINESDFSSTEMPVPQALNALLKSDSYTSGAQGSRQDYVLSITFDRDNNLFISSAVYDEDLIGGYIKKRRLTRITNSGVGNISIIKDYPAIRATGARENEIDEGIIFDIISFDALNQLWGLDVSTAAAPILYQIESCSGNILKQINPLGETGNEHIELRAKSFNFQYAPNNPEKKLHALCDGDFKPQLDITYKESKPVDYSYNGRGIKALSNQVDQIFPVLQQVVEKVCNPVKDDEYEKECLIAQCGNGYLDQNTHEIIRYEGAGINLVSSKLDAVIKLNQFLINAICIQEDERGCVALLPDERFAEFTVTKQLVLTLGEHYPTQNGSLWHVHIPMPINNLDWCTHFEPISITKGGVNGRLFWENSKLYTGSYFESEAEARRVLNQLAALSTANPRQKNGVIEPRITKGGRTKRIPQSRTIRCVRAVVSDLDPVSGEPTNVLCYTPPKRGCP